MDNLETGEMNNSTAINEAGKTSPVSLSSVENQSPNATPRNSITDLLKTCQKVGETTKMTLGQTLKNELRKSSLQLNRKTPTSQQQDNRILNSRNIMKQEEEISIKEYNSPENSADEDSMEEHSLLENENNWIEDEEKNVEKFETISGKRRRSRRNPVWQYFRVEDGTAVCRHCDYRTKSVFSTNLKVHLKSHHRRFFDQVLESETSMPTISSENPLKSPNSQVSQALMDLNSQFSDIDEKQLELLLKMNSSALFKANSENNLNSEKSNAELLALLTQQQNNQPQTSMKTLSNILNNSVKNPTTQMPILNAVLAATSSSVSPASSLIMNSAPGKRKRLRRHPVWKFFKDVDTSNLNNKTVGCTMCAFKTHSAFSTNLKMHLKAHHKIEYVEVMEMELETANTETENGSSGLRNTLGKRPRKTAEEIKYMIDKCKSNLDKEREKRNLLCGGGAAAVNSNNSSPNFEFNLNPENIPALFEQSDANKIPPMENLSVTEQLNAMIGLFVNQHESSLNPNEEKKSSKVVELNKKSFLDSSKVSPADLALIAAIEKCKKADQTDKLVGYRAEMKKDARDLAMAMLMETDGHLLEKDSFKLLLYTLAPEYKLPLE